MSASSKPPRETLGETAKLGTGPDTAFGPLAPNEDYRPAALEHVVEPRTVAATDYPATLAPAPAHMLVANGTLTLAEAVARLVNASTCPRPWPGKPATTADAQRWIAECHDEYVDYVHGHPIKIGLYDLRSGDPRAFLGYDRDNGEGRGAAALRGEA